MPRLHALPDGVSAGRNDPAQRGAGSSPVPGDHGPPAGSQFISPLCSSPSLRLSAWAAFCCADTARHRRGQHKLSAPGFERAEAAPAPPRHGCVCRPVRARDSTRRFLPVGGRLLCSIPTAANPLPCPAAARCVPGRSELQGRPPSGIPFARSLDPGEPQAGPGPAGGCRTGGAGGAAGRGGGGSRAGAMLVTQRAAGKGGREGGTDGGREHRPLPMCSPAQRPQQGLPPSLGWCGAAGGPDGVPLGPLLPSPADGVPGCWGCSPAWQSPVPTQVALSAQPVWWGQVEAGI